MKSMLFIGALLIGSQGFAAEYLVKINNSRAFSSINAMGTQKSLNLQVLEHNPTASLVLVNVGKNAEVKTLANLLSEPGVEYVVPNATVRSFYAPVDAAALKDQWANTKVQADKAWARAANKGNRNVIIAVIDTGVDYKHQALSQNMIAGYDFKDNDSDPMDVTSAQNPGHGTHCSGSIGSTGLIDGGTVGIAPEVSIMPLRFLGADGSGDLNSAIKAIDYAIEKGAHVISASWGAAIPASQAAPLVEAIKRADDAGLIFVAAAANDGKNNDTVSMYPANSGLPNTITVAASGATDAKPSWSNFGTAKVHVAAPGEGIMSTLPGNKYGNLSGTSMATPLVAGLVGFLKAQDPTLTGAQIRSILQTTGAKVNIQTACNCRVDAFQAVDAVLSKSLVVVPAAATIATNSTVNVAVLYGKSPFTFTSSNPAALTIDATGTVKAIAAGVATIAVTDADGKTATSLNYNVGGAANPPDNGGGGGGSCPIGDQAMCDIICKIMPTAPFCN